MASLLLTGPPGAGKTREAERLLSVASLPTIIVDFQQILASLLGLRRDPETGRYPLRRPEHDYALEEAEYTRLSQIGRARDRGWDVIATNGTGTPQRRQYLLSVLPVGAAEVIIDPGRDVVTRNLTVNGVFDPQCAAAISRYYDRLL